MKQIACAGLLFVLSCANGQTSAPPARDLTVRVFSTAPTGSVTIDSKSASMQACDVACKSVTDSGLVLVRAIPGVPDKVQVGSLRAHKLRVNGEVRLATDDDRHADAAGKWIVRPGVDGLHVLLTLPSERYVMAVLRSEAGQGEGAEALKALAVVARSFALTHPERHGIEGLCDSTHCQAARFSPVPERIREAVLATAGETLWFGGKRVDGYFAESCGGRTADAAEMWGGAVKPWLTSRTDPYCQRQPSQWHASLGRDELQGALRKEGLRVPAMFHSVRVSARDSSGRAKELLFEGDSPANRMNAASFRFAVNRELGWNRIRSDWYAMHMNGSTVMLDGKGFGHGVGLCQAGAAEMAREGKQYRDILGFYFAGAKVRVLANDGGWQAAAEDGWTLISTRSDTDVVRAGDTAWAEARKRWSGPQSVRPSVTLAPETEIFRQLTGKPGWALAATSGDRVTLQPVAVVKAHGGYEKLLVHEFLHVLVEADATAGAPLWLREGLVEVLAGEKGSANSLPAAQIEAALRHAENQREAQAAHDAAAARVSRLIAQYGLGNVRGWLRSGVPAQVLSR